MNRPCLAVFGAISGVLVALPAAAQQHPASADPRRDPDSEAVVRQISQATSPASRGAVEQLGQRERATARVRQLPADAEMLPSAPEPEQKLEQVTRRSPNATLYAEVAAVWELIRRRGQQPTPELIAREIGPDALARFLNSFPGSEGMFGVDSDTLPIKPPRDVPPPGHGG